MQARPFQSGIRVLALGLHWRRGRLLLAELCDGTGHTAGFRPIGGSVRYREPWPDTITREFQYAFGIDVKVRGDVTVLENIDDQQDTTSHEVVLVAEVMFADADFQGLDAIPFRKGSGLVGTARWIDLDRLDLGGDGPALLPRGLKAHLLAAGRS